MHPDTIQVSADTVGILSELRRRAEVTQTELAARIGVDPSRISRFEAGDVQISGVDVANYLKALRVPEADRYLAYLQQPWQRLSRPSFHNSDLQVLEEAERALQDIEDSRSGSPWPASMKPPLEMYEATIREAAQYLHRLDHPVAVVGDLGVGKSTAIALVANLPLSPVKDRKRLERIVLPTGGGRTTICEMEIKQGSHLTVVLEPQSEDEILTAVRELCLDLRGGGGGGPSFPEELERALRNMAGLARHPKDGGIVDHDPVEDLQREFPHAGDLAAEFFRRLNLPQRKATTFQHGEAAGVTQFAWLRGILKDLNYGLRLDASLPRRITIIVPFYVLDGPEYQISVVDTKGVEETSIRPDLGAFLDDRRSVIVLCSRFLSAPDATMRSFLEHAVSIGCEQAVRERVMMLVLHRGTEASEMKTSRGEPVETPAEGLAIKKQQVDVALRRSGLPIHFFDAARDEPQGAAAAILSQVKAVRSNYAARIRSASAAAGELIRELEDRPLRDALDEIGRSLAAFAQQHCELPPAANGCKPACHDLVNELRTRHQRTVWATINRTGSWWNLDVYLHLGKGATAVARSRSQQALGSLRGMVDSALQQAQVPGVHAFLEELQKKIESWFSSFLDNVRHFGQEVYKPQLKSDSALWSKCGDGYGEGRWHREDVAGIIEGWFEDPAQRDTARKLDAYTDREWESFLEHLSARAGGDAEGRVREKAARGR
jgi:transcriptional regulator with XRE-family HTH domain